MDSGSPLAAFGQPTGELIDDHNLALTYNVVTVGEVVLIDVDRHFNLIVDIDQRRSTERLGLPGRANAPAPGSS